MSTRLHLRRLPQPYRRPAADVARPLLSAYPNTVALIVIGSVALGTWEADSDLDLVWVHRGRLPRRWRADLDYRYEGIVELVPFNLKQVRRHFRQHSPMAHALRAGTPLHDPERLHAAWQRRELGPPSRQWIDETWEFMCLRLEWGLDSYRRERRFHRRAEHGTRDCFCLVSEILTRAALNLVRLLMTLDGHVPMCKSHMRELAPDLLGGPRLRRGMEVTLRAHHERRDLSLPEAEEVAYLGRWARRKLEGVLGIPEGGRLQQPRRVHPLPHPTGQGATRQTTARGTVAGGLEFRTGAGGR